MEKTGPVGLSPQELSKYRTRDYGHSRYDLEGAPRTEKAAKLDLLKSEYELLIHDIKSSVDPIFADGRGSREPVIEKSQSQHYHPPTDQSFENRAVQDWVLDSTKERLDKVVAMTQKMKEILDQMKRVAEDKE